MSDEWIDHTVFLKSTFGGMPDLRKILVSQLEFDVQRDYVCVMLTCTVPAQKLPAKWGEYDTIGMEISFFGITELALSAPGGREMQMLSEFAVGRKSSDLWQASFRKAFDCHFNFQHARADKFFPATLDDALRTTGSNTQH